MVYVDNQPIGTTPCATSFVYYGTREIRLVKPGYETLTINQPIPMPWYQIPPLDFVSENLTPQQIVDHRTVSFDMQPQLIVPTEQLLDRANQLRQETMQGAVVPAAATMPPPVVVPSGPIGAPITTPLPDTFAPPSTTPPFNLPPAGNAPPPFSPAPTSPPPFAA